MRKELTRRGALVCAVLFLAAAAARAQFTPQGTFPQGSVPDGINVQGSLEEQDLLVSGIRDIHFRVWTAQTGGTMLFESAIVTVNVEEGIWGTRVNIPTRVLLLPGPKWVEVVVDGLEVGRQQLHAVPYARIAQTVAGNLEISSGALTISTSTAADPALFLSSSALQVRIGTSTFVGSEALHVVGADANRDLVIGNHSQIGGSAGSDVFVVGNAAIGGAITGVTFGGVFQLIGVSTAINAAFVFRVGDGTMSVAGGGSVGLGVADPQRTLDITAAAIPGILLNHAASGVWELRRGGAGVLQLASHASSSTLATVGATDLTLEVGGAEVLRVESGGDVGFGAANPARTADAGGVVRSTSAETGALGAPGAPALIIADADTGLYTQGPNTLDATTAGSNRLTITALGDVGIGSLPPAGQRLLVVGGDVVIGSPVIANTSAEEDLLIEGNLKVDGSVNQSMAALNSLTSASVDGTVGAGDLFVVGAGTFVVREGGTLGIGTTNPAAALQIEDRGSGVIVNHPTQPQIILEVGAANRLQAQHTGTVGEIGTLNASTLRLATLGTPKITIEGGGDVGVGETNPTQPLDVGGALTIEGTLTLGAALGVASGGTAGTAPFNARNGLSLAAASGFDATVNSLWPVRISSTAAEAVMLEYDPPDCLAADFFPRGFAATLDVEACTDATSSLDLTEPTNEGRIYDNDNNLDVTGSSWTVIAAGANDIAFDSGSDTFFIDVSADRIGIGASNPSEKLDVQGGDVNASGKLREAGGDLIPAGAVIFSTWTSGCPAGWAELTAARGRMVVGLPAAGTLAGVSGTALGNLAQRNHTHTLSGHTHDFNPPAHDHGLNSHTHSFDPDGGGGHTHTLSNHTHTLDPDGAGHTHTQAHTHNVDYPNTASGTTLGLNLVADTVGAANGTSTALHTHSLDLAAAATTGSSQANTGSRNIAATASGGPSTNSSSNTNLASVGSSAAVGNTASFNIPAQTSGAPSTDATDTVAVTMPYVQLRVCEKS